MCAMCVMCVMCNVCEVCVVCVIMQCDTSQLLRSHYQTLVIFECTCIPHITCILHVQYMPHIMSVGSGARWSG